MTPPACRRLPPYKRERGVSIITAIFMLLLFAALAAYMATLINTANITSAQDVQGARAYHAAQAGLEWGIYQVQVPAAASCAAATTLPAPVGGYTVVVTCTATGPYFEGATTFTLYRLTSTASPPVGGPAVGSPGYVERQVAGTVSR